MFTTNLKATMCTHIYTLRVIANKPTKVIKWNHKKLSNSPEKGRRGNKEQMEKWTTNNKVTDLNPVLPIITLNVNGLNTPTKNRHKTESPKLYIAYKKCTLNIKIKIS